MKELIAIQKELKVHKAQKNSFGNYNYRSCEDILEAVKPLCHKHNCALTIYDEMIMLGDRFYVQATVTLQTEDGKTVGESKAFARESETKKGMDASQITGSASSYARKYALNGLFCIDDTKDADTMNNNDIGNRPAPKPVENMASDQQLKTLTEYVKKFESSDSEKSVWISKQIKTGLTFSKADNIIMRIMKA